MKTFFFILLILINFCNKAAAQAGVSINNPNASAALDLSSISNKGLLIPRVSLSGLSDSNSIAGAHPAVALWLYNTNAGLGDGAELYTWQGSKMQIFLPERAIIFGMEAAKQKFFHQQTGETI